MAKTSRSAQTCSLCGVTIPAGAPLKHSNARGYRCASQGTCANNVAAKRAALAATTAAAEGPAVVTGGDRATDRQIRYALDLIAAYWTPAVLGGLKPTHYDLAAMNREQVSRVIDALVIERECARA